MKTLALIIALSAPLMLKAETEIKELERFRDVAALTLLLKNSDGRIRSSAAVSLSNAIRSVDVDSFGTGAGPLEGLNLV